MAGVIDPSIVPLFPDRTTPPARPDAMLPPRAPAAAGADEGLEALEELVETARQAARLLDAAGIAITWQDHDRDAVTLFADGACKIPYALSGAASDTLSLGGHDGALDAEWRALDDAVPGGLLTVGIPAGHGVVTIAALFHGGAESARDAAADRAARLLPILRPFFRLWIARQRAAARLRGLAGAVDKADVGILLVNARGQLTFANAAAQALMEQGDGLKRSGALLGGSRLSDTLRLQATIEHVVTGGDAALAPAPVVALTRRDKRPLLVAIVASDNAAAGAAHGVGAGTRAVTGAEDVAAIVYVFDPEQELRPLVEPACRLYGLSPVESRLTCLLADGIGLAEAATRMHVREQTARSYLKQIFLKTETNRQAELVWLMLKSAVRTAPGCRTSFI